MDDVSVLTRTICERMNAYSADDSSPPEAVPGIQYPGMKGGRHVPYVWGADWLPAIEAQECRIPHMVRSCHFQLVRDIEGRESLRIERIGPREGNVHYFGSHRPFFSASAALCWSACYQMAREIP